MGKRAITIFSINVDTESMVNMGLNLKYISKFNSPFLGSSFICLKTRKIVRSRYSAGAESVIGFVVNLEMCD